MNFLFTVMSRIGAQRSVHGQDFQHVGLPGLAVTAIHGQENVIPAGEKAPIDQKLNGPRFKIFG